MPFAYGPFNFSEAGISSINAVGGVYGLARPQPFNPGYYTILYVGKTNELPKRLREHLNNPPVAGITHFFAEAISTEAARTQREYTLIQEFKPVGNTLLK
jgi:excinuclease UvrABC nuclease subunit